MTKNPSPRDWESDVIETFEREKVDALQAYKDKLRASAKEMSNIGAYEDWGTYNEGFEAAREEFLKLLDEGEDA